MSEPGRDAVFSDLAARFGTGVALAAIGLLAVWAGGWWFLLLVCILAGTLIWELAGMLGAPQSASLQLGIGAGAALLLARLLPVGLGLPILLLAAIAGIAILTRHRTIYVPTAAIILLSAFGILIHREDFGLTWMVWLVLVVAATDIFGYFAGRMIGGPKFWPRVSPKKTWAGTVAGWVSAGVVGAGFMTATGSGVELIGISVAVSMASQMGDIAESAIKRRMGVKDSSNLLPGHGGVLDRFDGMIGAALLVLLVESFTDFPPPPL